MVVHVALSMNKYFNCLRIIRNFNKYSLKMSPKGSLQKLEENSNKAKQTIQELKNELRELTSEYNKMLALHLTEENSRLTAAVEAAKKKLIELEIENGIKQIPLPNQPPLIAISESKPSQIIPETPQQQQQQPEPPKASKLKKDKKPPKEQPATEEPPVDIGRLDLRVAKVLEVQKHPDADSLYVLKIDCGEEKPRTVCSGLVKHVPMAELQNRMVVLLCNLKPVKMRGVTSEAMVMCASSPEAVEVLSPPEGASPGEPVCCPGFERRPDAVMNPKKKIFESVAPDLHTNGELEACYKNVAFEVPGKGRVVAKSLKNVAVK